MIEEIESSDQTAPPALDDTSWAARPSKRPHFIGLFLTVAFGYFASQYIGPWFQAFIDSTADSITWNDKNILMVYRILQGVVYIPVVFVVFRFIRAMATRYSIQDGRLIYDHGILVRRHDQIALQRVRDYRIISPIFQRMIGTGTIQLISRDETYPKLAIGPLTHPMEAKDVIRAAVLAQQESVGYREFEST